MFQYRLFTLGALFADGIWRIQLKYQNIFLRMQVGGNLFYMNWLERDYVIPGVLSLVQAELRKKHLNLSGVHKSNQHHHQEVQACMESFLH